MRTEKVSARWKLAWIGWVGVTLLAAYQLWPQDDSGTWPPFVPWLVVAFGVPWFVLKVQREGIGAVAKAIKQGVDTIFLAIGTLILLGVLLLIAGPQITGFVVMIIFFAIIGW